MRSIFIKPASAVEFVAFEEAMSAMALDGRCEPTVAVVDVPRLLYLTREASVNHVDEQYAMDSGLSVVRSAVITGSVTSIILAPVVGVYLFARDCDMDALRRVVARASSMLGAAAEVGGRNDITAVGTDRKLGGAGTGEGASVAFLTVSPAHGLDVDSLFRMPASKFEGKTVASVSARMASVEGLLGEVPGAQEVSDAVEVSLAEEGFAPAWGEVTDEEAALARSMEARHAAEHWVRYADYEEPDFI
jgi:hypothetical protein